MAKNAAASISFGVIASNVDCGIVNSVEFDRSDRILISFFFQEISVVETQMTRCRTVRRKRFHVKEAITFDS